LSPLDRTGEDRLSVPAPRNDALALARFVLAPTKATNGKSLDQQWGDLASFLRGPASTLARWLAIGQMHAIYKQMRLPERREKLQTIGKFVERARSETGLSSQSIYNYVERARTLFEALGPTVLRAMLTGQQVIANDENLLIKVAQLPPEKALKVAQTYMRGGKGEAAAARLVERYLHDQRLSGLTSTHEPKLRGGSLVNGASTSEPAKGDPRNVTYFGDALVHLRESLRPDSVQCCVTSPPFYGQRDFGTRHWFGGNPDCKHDRKVTNGPFRRGDVAPAKYKTGAASEGGQKAITHSCSKCGAWYGQLGQEPDVGMYIEHIVEVFREVRRVLRADGVAWIEIGDTYNAYNGNRGPSSKPQRVCGPRSSTMGQGARAYPTGDREQESATRPPAPCNRDPGGWMDRSVGDRVAQDRSPPGVVH
jgi:DNA methylase